MELILGAIVGTAGAAAVGWFVFSRRPPSASDPWAIALDQVAQTFDLKVHPAPQFSPHGSCRGRVGRHAVELDTYAVPDAAPVTRIRVSGGTIPDLTLQVRGPLTRLSDAFGGFESKDPIFDVDVVVGGESDARALSRLDAPCREAVCKAITSGATLKDSEWTLTMTGHVTHAQRLINALRAVLSAAEALERTDGTIEEGLRDLVRDDPNPRVRLQAARFHRAPHVSAAFTLLLEDADPENRRQAAVALARLGAPDPVRIEGILLAHLHNPNADLIDALGRVGTPASIPALQEMTESRLNLGATSRRGNQAIQEIIARTGGPSPARSKQPE